MVIGKLVNIYPFFFSDYLFYPLDSSIDWCEKNSRHLTNTRAAFGSYENYLTLPKFSNDGNVAVEMVICGHGIGYFKCEHEVVDGDTWTDSVQTLIDTAGEEMDRLNTILKDPKFEQFLTNHHLPIEIEISYVYSHNFILDDNVEKVARNLGNTDPQASNLENIKVFYCNSTANIFQFKDKDYDYFINLCANITVFSASIYVIQEISLKESMELIKNKFLIENENSITEIFHTKVSYFNQHLVNMKGMNFVDNILVDRTIGRIAAEWDWDGVLNSTERAVEHFSAQITKVENENKRKSDRRENTILLGFTLLSIISTVAGVIQLYDLQNTIEPVYRIVAVTLAFLCSIILAYRYLGKKDK